MQEVPVVTDKSARSNVMSCASFAASGVKRGSASIGGQHQWTSQCCAMDSAITTTLKQHSDDRKISLGYVASCKCLPNSLTSLKPNLPDYFFISKWALEEIWRNLWGFYKFHQFVQGRFGFSFSKHFVFKLGNTYYLLVWSRIIYL